MLGSVQFALFNLHRIFVDLDEVTSVQREDTESQGFITNKLLLSTFFCNFDGAWHVTVQDTIKNSGIK